jgi:2'-5' RNA ligase
MRLFVAAYPPLEVVEGLQREALRLGDGGRPTPPGQVHVTLQFIGERSVRELDETIESVERACAGQGAMEALVSRVRTWPVGDQPSMVVALVDAAPGLLELHRRLAVRLATAKGKTQARSKGEGYEPHLTLARFAKGKEPEVGEVEIQPIRFRIDRVRLVSSEVKPSGVEHRRVHELSLGR